MKTPLTLAAALAATCALALPTLASDHHGSHASSSKAKVAPAKVYRNVRGQFVKLIPAQRAGAISSGVVDHEEIPRFMVAMRMVIPFQNAADARKFKAGDKIAFDMVLRKGTFLIANPRLLPRSTRLKLAKAPMMHHSAAGGH